MIKTLCLALLVLHATLQVTAQETKPVVQTINGGLEGEYVFGIKTFKGIPYAQPPVGDLRWKEPQPVKNWQGNRKADQFGPRAMQRALFSDMNFRSNGISEDCLYLNVWTPAKTGNEKLPVLVYFFGGGFVAGDGSEPHYDGESMARQGIVAVTVNFRLTIFGFFVHPELTKESPHQASGNYGLMDQAEALRWVQKNIAAFGGDPKKVTIAGESAGSFSVSAQMASPLSKNLIAGAIGESGSLMGTQPTATRADVEKMGVQFATMMGASSLAALRAMPAEQILEGTAKQGAPRFPVVIDGYFFPKSPLQIYAAGEQAKVPLLVGWNSEEGNYRSILGQDPSTVDNYNKAMQKIFGERSTEALAAYTVKSDNEVEAVATSLASDRFIGFSTWKWSDLQSKTGGKPVYRYFYSRPRPATRVEAFKAGDTAGMKTPGSRGAAHSAEIEYAMGNLPGNRVFDWQPDDYRVSAVMQAYFANFIKTGNPNGPTVPAWNPVTAASVPVMHIDVESRLETEKNRQHYLFMEKLAAK